MTEKLKYKVGDKVLVEAEVIEVDKEDTDLPYRVNFGAKDAAWLSGQSFNQIITIPPRPKIKQAVMDYYLKYRDRDWFFGTWFSFESMSYEVKNWLYSDKKLRLQHQHALATLIAYGPEAVEVEKEKKYRVLLKGTTQYLSTWLEVFRFTVDRHEEELQYEFTKQELIDAGFEGVFDNPMFEVEEVE